MEVEVSIFYPDKEQEPIHKDIMLSNLATSKSLIVIEDKKYIVCQTLFKPESTTDNYTQFEQILEHRENEGDYSVSHLVLCGKIWFKGFEKDVLFRDVKTDLDKNELNEGRIISLPYAYMRSLDCVKIGDKIYRCNNIMVNMEISSTLSFYPRDFSADLFRANIHRVC